MVHTLKTIAHNFRLDANKFIEFASLQTNERKFGIITEYDQLCTTTWYTDDLVKAFKKSLEAKPRN